MFGFADGGRAQWTAIVFGLGAILYSLVTDYELSVVRVVPMPLHLVLDGAAGLLLAAAPWLLGFAHQVRGPHLAFGVFSVDASLITRTRAAVG